ncbi:MAG: YigZ family protein [Flavobacteriaceae bacterium]|nr:YigZ family protein [Flavobacteriaceae bacterium]
MPYLIPTSEYQSEIEIKRSRFVSIAGFADTVDAAKAFLRNVQEILPGANHYVYAYRIGYGKTITEGMSDAGEPSGTAGPPTLAVVRGTDIGDVVLVTARYFGGTKLGTGGLVRAYTESAQVCFEGLPTTLKIEKTDIALLVPYRFFDSIQRSLPEFEAEVIDTEFAEDVTLSVRLPRMHAESFTAYLVDLTAGAVILES